MTPEIHKRYLDYRSQHEYFGGATTKLSMTEFEVLDREHLALDAKGEEGRDDEEEARYEELSKLLFRD